jgi:hypothetical protein
MLFTVNTIHSAVCRISNSSPSKFLQWLNTLKIWNNAFVVFCTQLTSCGDDIQKMSMHLYCPFKTNLPFSCHFSKFSQNMWSFDHLFTAFQIKVVFSEHIFSYVFKHGICYKDAKECGCDLELIVYNAV